MCPNIPIYICPYIVRNFHIYIQICYTRLSLYYPIYIYTRIISIFLGSFDFELLDWFLPPKKNRRQGHRASRKGKGQEQRDGDRCQGITSGYRAMGQNLDVPSKPQNSWYL